MTSNLPSPFNNPRMGTSTTDFDGLVTLLANHLYADADVFVRELVQNAQDVIIRA
jgi:HSP90 family molecular chaperone